MIEDELSRLELELPDTGSFVGTLTLKQLGQEDSHEKNSLELLWSLPFAGCGNRLLAA